MKIPFTNIEIKTPQVFVQPNPGNGGPMVTISKANQQTLPSLPLKSSFPRADLGDSGTTTLHGIIGEEYNSQLQGVQGIKVFEEMRKSDGTVRSAMLVTTLPIRRANWFVNPATEDQQDKDVANFVEHALFDWLDGTWDDVIRQALLMVPFGVMLFEKVYTTHEYEGKTYVTLEKLAPRLPKSVMQWELPDRTFGIQQIRQDGIVANIPGSKLLIFVNEREGDNWWGTSMLRAAYKHWYYKNNFYKIDAMAFERQGLGVPMVKMPAGYTESDERKATQAMQNLRSNESAYLLLPPGYEAEFMNMGSSTTRDPSNSISHHNREILKSVLAQFLELGAQNKSGGTGGSRALSNDHSDLFLKAIEAIANTIVSEINKNLIPELINLNFNDIKVYPVLDFSGIRKVDMEALASSYSSLVTAGAITPTDDDQQYIRTALGLPPRTQEQIDSQASDEPTMVDELDHMDIEDDGVDDAAATAQATKDAKPNDKAAVDKAAKKKASKRPSAQLFTAPDGFMSWRPLTFAEKNVNWKKIQDTMDTMEANFTMQAKELLRAAKDTFMAKLHAAIDSGDQKAVTDLEVAFASNYKDLLKNAMKEAYIYGKNNASTEIGVQPPPSTADTLANIDLMADTIASKTVSDIEAKAKIAAANAMKQDANALQTSGSIDALLDEAIDKAVTNTAGIIVGQNINSGRNDVFERNSADIYALQRSEVLDKDTCDFCLSMDGLVVDQSDPWAAYDVFHNNCRGIWVAIGKDEKNPPDVTGVPEDLADYYGGQPNSLVQPPRPILQPGSPAEEEVQRRKDEKAAKSKK